MLFTPFFEDVVTNDRADSSSDNESYDRTPYHRIALCFGFSLRKRPHAVMIARSLVASGQGILHASLMELRSKGRTLALTHTTGVIGVINVTPDSYVPDSRAQASDTVLALAQKYIDGGADILEIGDRHRDSSRTKGERKNPGGRRCTP